MQAVLEIIQYWRPFLNQEQPIGKCVPIRVALTAIRDLITIEKAFSCTPIVKSHAIDIVIRVAKCVVDLFPEHEEGYQNNFLEFMQNRRVHIQQELMQSDVEEFRRETVIGKLDRYDPRASAFKALMECLITEAMMEQVFGIEFPELFERCLIEAKLQTVDDVIGFLNDRSEREENVLLALADRLKTYRENQREQMPEELKVKFDEQWNFPVDKDRLDLVGRIFQPLYLHKLKKCATDFYDTPLMDGA